MANPCKSLAPGDGAQDSPVSATLLGPLSPNSQPPVTPTPTTTSNPPTSSSDTPVISATGFRAFLRNSKGKSPQSSTSGDTDSVSRSSKLLNALRSSKISKERDMSEAPASKVSSEGPIKKVEAPVKKDNRLRRMSKSWSSKPVEGDKNTAMGQDDQNTNDPPVEHPDPYEETVEDYFRELDIRPESARSVAAEFVEEFDDEPNFSSSQPEVSDKAVQEDTVQQQAEEPNLVVTSDDPSSSVASQQDDMGFSLSPEMTAPLFTQHLQTPTPAPLPYVAPLSPKPKDTDAIDPNTPKSKSDSKKEDPESPLEPARPVVLSDIKKTYSLRANSKVATPPMEKSSSSYNLSAPSQTDKKDTKTPKRVSRIMEDFTTSTPGSGGPGPFDELSGSFADYSSDEDENDVFDDKKKSSLLAKKSSGNSKQQQQSSSKKAKGKQPSTSEVSSSTAGSLSPPLTMTEKALIPVQDALDSVLSYLNLGGSSSSSKIQKDKSQDSDKTCTVTATKKSTLTKSKDRPSASGSVETNPKSHRYYENYYDSHEYSDDENTTVTPPNAFEAEEEDLISFSPSSDTSTTSIVAPARSKTTSKQQPRASVPSPAPLKPKARQSLVPQSKKPAPPSAIPRPSSALLQYGDPGQDPPAQPAARKPIPPPAHPPSGQYGSMAARSIVRWECCRCRSRTYWENGVCSYLECVHERCGCCYT